MKKLYDIRINPEKPSSEEVAKHMDFDALLKEFEAAEKQRPKVVQMRQRPVRRWILVAASFALVVMATFAIQRVFFKSESLEQVAQPFINPPIKSIEKSFSTLEIDTEEGGEFVMEDGTKIYVPKNAFVDASGTIILGTVSLKYRKFQDIEDIFLSGIPMQYDSANVRYNMASVGMMELVGVYDNQVVDILPNKYLTVELVAQTDLNQVKNYNVYQLDTVAKNWKFVDVDDITLDLDEATSKRIDAALAESEIVKKIASNHSTLAQLEREKTAEIQSINARKLPQKPSPPYQPNEGGFILDFDLSAFANEIEGHFDTDFEQDRTATSAEYEGEDLTQYANVMWSVSTDQERAYNKATSDIVWRSVKLNKINENRFKLELATGQTKVELFVSPVLNGQQLDAANAKYREALADYEEALAIYQRDIKPKIEVIENDYANRISSLTQEMAVLQRSYNKARITAMRAIDLDLQNQKIVNRFKVSQFGIWNCDKPETIENRTVKAKFQDKDGAPIDYYMVYVADKNSGRVQRFYTTQRTEITYNPKAENVLWLVSKNGKIAVAKSSEFDKIGNSKRFTFTLEKLSQQVSSKEDVRRILGL